MFEVRFFFFGFFGFGDRCWDGFVFFFFVVVFGDEFREKIELFIYFGKRFLGVLYCIIKFCDYGKVVGVEEYV